MGSFLASGEFTARHKYFEQDIRRWTDECRKGEGERGRGVSHLWVTVCIPYLLCLPGCVETVQFLRQNRQGRMTATGQSRTTWTSPPLYCRASSNEARFQANAAFSHFELPPSGCVMRPSLAICWLFLSGLNTRLLGRVDRRLEHIHSPIWVSAPKYGRNENRLAAGCIKNEASSGRF